jgi:transcriptional regulator with PAS, ATPase and Fis domain
VFFASDEVFAWMNVPVRGDERTLTTKPALPNRLPRPREDLKLILDAISDGIFIYDGNSNLIAANQKAADIFNSSEEEMLGRNVGELATWAGVKEFIAPGFAGRPLSDIRKSVSIEDYSLPGYMIFDSGKKMLYNGTYVRDDDGTLLLAIYTMREATDLNQARKKIDELEQLTRFYDDQLRTLKTQFLGHEFIAVSKSTQEVYRQGHKFARLDANLLITGETGTGKTSLARYIHAIGPRSHRPFLSINCASLPEALVEAELFGYVDGAFTGAARGGHRGLIESAEGGTVLLDEISEMPRALQAKLLTVVDEKSVRRIGGSKSTEVDVRFISATNRSGGTLKTLLREDLFFRLSALKIHILPLSARPDDIPPMVEQALREHNTEHGTRISFAPDLVRGIQACALSGNVRELKNLTCQIASEAEEPSSIMELANLSEALRVELIGGRQDFVPPAPGHPRAETDWVDERYLRELCAAHRGDVHAMAKQLGVHRTTIIRKLRSYSIPYSNQRLQASDRGQR